MRLDVALVLFQVFVARSEDEVETGAGSSQSGQITLRVDHSLDGGKTFSSRGPLNIQNLRSGAASMDSSYFSLEPHHKKQLRDLCASDDMYLMKLTNPEEADVAHHTAVHACNLIQSGLGDVFTVHLDWRNKVVGVSVSAGLPASLKLSEEGRDTLEAVNNFKAKVTVQHMETGPQPDTAAFIQRMEQEKLAKERGETKDNRSFFAKYWMYIIPVVLVLAMSGANPEAQR